MRTRLYLAHAAINRGAAPLVSRSGEPILIGVATVSTLAGL
jgi:hypothetical protein